MTTYNEAITKAGRTLAEGYHQMLNVGTPREAAERAHTPGGPSVDELEARIAKRRAELLERVEASDGACTAGGLSVDELEESIVRSREWAIAKGGAGR